MRVIKGYAASAHHILAAKLEQMCCLWDPMGVIKDHQRQVMSKDFSPVHTSLNNFNADRNNLLVQTHGNWRRHLTSFFFIVAKYYFKAASFVLHKDVATQKVVAPTLNSKS